MTHSLKPNLETSQHSISGAEACLEIVEVSIYPLTLTILIYTGPCPLAAAAALKMTFGKVGNLLEFDIF